jgi:hypothetical protein
MAQANPPPEQQAPAADEAERKPSNQELYEAEKKRLEEVQERKERKAQERLLRKQQRQERERLAYWGKLLERLLTYGVVIFIFYMLSLLPWGPMYRWVMYEL